MYNVAKQIPRKMKQNDVGTFYPVREDFVTIKYAFVMKILNNHNTGKGTHRFASGLPF